MVQLVIRLFDWQLLDRCISGHSGLEISQSILCISFRNDKYNLMSFRQSEAKRNLT